MFVSEDSPIKMEIKTAELAELTNAALGQRLSMSRLGELLDSVELSESSTAVLDGVWVGSVGYEKYRDIDVFARLLADAGVERLIDVRELPISRKRGFAKSAMSEALSNAGVEYVHLRALGNPKEFRDLYKSGRVEAGKNAYQRFLLSERSAELDDLNQVLREKRSALMCVEDDPQVCHRQVILDALRDRLEENLVVTNIS